MTKTKTIPRNIFLEKIEIDKNYGKRNGYSENFLKEKIGLPALTSEQKKQSAKVSGNSNELKYCHFSIVMNKERKMPFFAAANLDGASYNKIKVNFPTRKEIGPDKWSFDSRIDESFQIPKSFYDNNDFDLGHLVRREYAIYGKDKDEALKGNNDTFHLTNATPQHKDFNRGAKIWKGLEEYAIKNARKNSLKISVFIGPVFDKKDKTFKGVGIPKQFWKIITMVKEDGTLSSTGYLLSQEENIKDMRLEAFTYGKFLTFQVPISKIESLTGLKFNLSKFDPMKKKKGIGLESIEALQQRLIDRSSKIIF